MILVQRLVQEETYTFTPEGESEPVHIRSGALRKWLLDRVPERVVNLTFPDQPLEELVELHGLEADRMAPMTEEEAKDPVIVGLWPGGTHILIDGGHRRWFWAKRGVTVLRGWAVPFEIWSCFMFDPTAPGVLRHHAGGESLPQRRKK